MPFSASRFSTPPDVKYTTIGARSISTSCAIDTSDDEFARANSPDNLGLPWPGTPSKTIHRGVFLDLDVGSAAVTVPCTDCCVHTLHSLRLRRAYFVYCFVCFLLSAVLCTSMLARIVKLKIAGYSLASHQFRTWETVLEGIVGLAVCGETCLTCWLSGRWAFLRDCWHVLDAAVVALTLLHWCIFVISRVLRDANMMELDAPFLALRFVLQPCRVLAAVSMVKRVRDIQMSVQDIDFGELTSVTEWPQSPKSALLTEDIQDLISEHLPTWCRFAEWKLAYSPRVHGTSMKTFYRSQDRGGANVVLVQDSGGRLLGGFSSEPCASTRGAIMERTIASCSHWTAARQRARATTLSLLFEKQLSFTTWTATRRFYYGATSRCCHSVTPS